MYKQIIKQTTIMTRMVGKGINASLFFLGGGGGGGGVHILDKSLKHLQK